MKRFYDREREIEKLKRIGEQSKTSAQFTVVSGRRRIGKTRLIRKAFEDTPFIYLFVARKTESELCESFLECIRDVINIPMVGRVMHFADIFRFLMELATKRHLTVVIDEFQEFYRINPSVYSDMQDIWDSMKEHAQINLIVCGSVNSLLNRIFRDKKEPLYGRQTDALKIAPFTPSVLKEILHDYSPDYMPEDLLALYMLTGGVAKYVELFLDKGCSTKDSMLDAVFDKDSFFLDEGKAMLIEEFGKDYGTYFSILSLIAQGHSTRGDIENILNTEIGGYMKRLIDDYELVIKRQPLFETSSNKNVRYAIGDNFLRFWFRFIFRYSYMIEAGGHQRLKTLVERDYEGYSGRVLEDYFRAKLRESGQYTRMGYWHSRKGDNEIDIIAQDELDKIADFYDVKRQAKDVDMKTLSVKVENFLQSTHEFKHHSINLHGLSMNEM